jgi:F-type H+-transporting ATPase subunit epsilon
MSTASSSTTPLHLVVVTPEATVLDAPVDFVTVPLFDGELGIAKNHAPLIGRLGFGELRYKVGGTTQRYYVDGGFVQMDKNVVSVLTNRALPTGELDAEKAREQLTAALARRPKNPEEMALRDRLQLQARAQIRLANR